MSAPDALRESAYNDGESSVTADIECHLNEHCGQPDGDERTWAEYTAWMWLELNNAKAAIKEARDALSGWDEDADS